MKSYKEQTLEACRKMIGLYENFDKNYMYFCCSRCVFCKIYFKNNDYHTFYTKQAACRGCFMHYDNNPRYIANKYGCTYFSSYIDAMNAYNQWREDNSEKNHLIMIEKFQRRAKFFRDIIPLLEKLPEKKFTPGWWSYFDIDMEK